LNLVKGRADLVAGSIDMDPRRSGHYDRYTLLVGYLLQDRKLTVDDVLAKRLDKNAVESELRSALLIE
jgi:hypothetical protein